MRKNIFQYRCSIFICLLAQGGIRLVIPLAWQGRTYSFHGTVQGLEEMMDKFFFNLDVGKDFLTVIQIPEVVKD